MARTLEEMEQSAIEAREALNNWDWEAAPPLDATSLRKIYAANLRVIDANWELRKAVVEARAAGMDWSSIGMMLGVSKQAARQRFGKLQAS